MNMDLVITLCLLDVNGFRLCHCVIVIDSVHHICWNVSCVSGFGR